jgi:hypothetical protein
MASMTQPWGYGMPLLLPGPLLLGWFFFLPSHTFILFFLFFPSKAGATREKVHKNVMSTIKPLMWHSA